MPVFRPRFLTPGTVAALMMLVIGGGNAFAAEGARAAKWSDWWLPEVHSAHGPSVDWLFKVIFWITMVIFVGVEILLVYFAIKYRYRPERKKGIFSHGNTRLEMVWTIAPTIVLLWISLATKKVWDEFRYGNAKDTNRAQFMVIGQQFKWNFIYPGPDGKIGRYLTYSKPSDPEYAYKPADQAMREVGTELLGNPLGQRMNAKDPADPGLDDDYVAQPGRPLVIPVDRPLDIALGSRDVLHSFFLPNFRVKLDAVPGMRGRILFTATKQSTRSLPVESVPDDKTIWLDSSTPKAIAFGNPVTFQLFDPKVIAPEAPDAFKVDPNTLDVPTINRLISVRSTKNRKYPWLQSLQSTLRDGAIQRLREKSKGSDGEPTFTLETAPKDMIDAEVAALRLDLKKMGINELAFVDEPFEIVCEELCGAGHGLMNGQMIVVSADQYSRFINKTLPGTAPAPSTSPTTAPATQQTAALPTPK